MKYFKIQNERVPALGFGTWQIKGQDAFKTIKNSLEAGYRLIDTAQRYGNEDKVGKAIQESDVDREDIFLITKLWRDKLRYKDVLKAFEKSLKRLKTDYVDLLLIHWPNNNVPLKETLDAMGELQEEGVVKHIGVSNFTGELLQKAQMASSTPIFANEVEYHPFLAQDDLLDHCRKTDTLFISYSPLARGRITKSDEIQEIAEKHGKTPFQVTLRWHLQQENVVPIPKAANRKHQKENFNIFDFQLSDEEMNEIFALGKTEKRLIEPGFAPWKS